MTEARTLSLPDNASLATRVRVALQCLEVLKNDPADPTCGQLINICLDLNVYASLAQQLQRSEEGRRMLAERPSLQGRLKAAYHRGRASQQFLAQLCAPAQQLN